MAKSKVYELAIKINGKLDSSLKKACAAAAQNLETVGNAAKTAGKVVAGASAAIVGATATMGAAAVNAAAEYQTQLANISTLLTGTEAEVAARTAEIGDQVLEISNKTGVVTDNLTDGMYQVISAFGDSADAASILETAAKSAAAGNATTADSINLLSAVTKGYGDTSAAAVQKAADLSFATVRLGQTSFPELAASMGKVIPLAGTLGLEQEQLFGAMATLTGVTGSTAEVVTQLKATMQGFLSPSKNMQAALASMGYESGQALLESKGLQGALDALKDSVHGDELAFAGLFSSVEAQTAVLAMAGTQSENLASKTAEMYEAAGAADTAFQRQTNTLKYTVQTVKNLGKNFLTQIGTNILPYVNDLAEAALPKVQNALENAGDYVEKSIIPTAEKAVKWIGENKTAILTVASAAVTAVGAFKGLQVATAAVGAVKNLSTIFKAASGGGKILNAVLSMGGVKLAIIAGIIAAVAAGFVLLWNKSEKFRETVMVLWGQLQALGGALADMAGAIWAKAAPLLEMLGNALLNGLERAVDLLAPVAGNILGIFTGIADFITGVFTGDWDKALQGLQNIFGNALSGLGNLAVAGFTAILEIGTSIWPAIDNAVQAGIAAISNRFPVLGAVLGSLWSTVQKVWSNIQVILQNAIQFVQNVFAGNWSGAWQNIVNIFSTIFSTVASIAMAPMNMLANGVQAAINSVAAFLSEKFPFLGALFSGWAASISAAIENIKAIFSGIIDFVQNVFSGNWSAAWQNIVDIFGNLFGMIVNLAKAPINGVISAINFVLEKINGISVTIPDWVPGVGGTTLGFNIPTIPQLATGGIVTAPTILEAGEGGEAEAILPLSKLAAMLQSVANAPEIPQMESGEKAAAAAAEITAITMIPPQLIKMLEAWADRAPEAPGVIMPEIQDLGNREDGPEEAPLAQLAKMLDDWTKNNKPDPHGPGQGGGGGRDLPEPQPTGANGDPPPAGGQNPPGGGVDTITFAPVFNFYGPTTPEQAKEAGQISFAEFKRMYDRMKAEERRKNLSASTR